MEIQMLWVEGRARQGEVRKSIKRERGKGYKWDGSAISGLNHAVVLVPHQLLLTTMGKRNWFLVDAFAAFSSPRSSYGSSLHNSCSWLYFRENFLICFYHTYQGYLQSNPLEILS